jgi:hypothetical protein
MGNEKEGTATSNPTDTTNTNINNEKINFKLLKKIVTNAGTPEQNMFRVFRVQQGKEVKQVRLTASELSRPASLEERLLKAGGFYMTEPYLTIKKRIKQAEDNSNAITINEVEGMGFIPSFNCWVFSNAVLNNDGNLLAYDKDTKCYMLDNGERIVKKEGRYKEAEINTEPDIRKIKELIQNIVDARNGDISFVLMLGFIYASIRSNLIYDTYGYFPVLFVSGDRSSGKSSLIRLALSSIGYKGAGDSNDSTPIGINRQLASTYSLPYWVDEYRNDKQGQKHEANIRRVYDRQTRTKGQKSLDNETIQTEINGTLIFSGQAEIVDTATRSRLIAIQLKEKDKTNPELFQSVDTQEGRHSLSGLARLMISNKNINDDELLKRINDTKKLLQKELIGGVADIGRLSSNYALAYVFSGLLLELIGINQDEISLYKKVVGIMLKEKELSDGIDTIADLFTCATNPEMLNSKSGWLIAKKDDQILLKPEAITLFKEHKKRIDEPVTLDTNAIRELLKVKVNATSKTVSIANDKQRYWTFPLNSEVLSRYETLNDVNEAISERTF